MVMETHSAKRDVGEFFSNLTEIIYVQPFLGIQIKALAALITDWVWKMSISLHTSNADLRQI